MKTSFSPNDTTTHFGAALILRGAKHYNRNSVKEIDATEGAAYTCIKNL
jgi:hypothetical protein